MTIQAARLAITTQFELALAAYPVPKPVVEYDNRNLIDTTKQVLPYISLSIFNISGKQLDLADKPMTMQAGQIVISANVKEGGGSLVADRLLDYFIPWFELKELGIVRTHSGVASGEKTVKGWCVYPILVPFWWIRVAT